MANPNNFLSLLTRAKTPTGGYIYGQGAVVPSDAATGWAKGALFIQTDGTAGSVLYVNEGTEASADFNTAVNAANAAVTDVTAGTVAASKAVVVDSNKDVAAFRNVGVVNLDAGSSGVAGTVDVFPATASKGKAAITCANQAGNTTVTFTFAEMADARTITVPDPGDNASVVVTAGNQTIGGVKTFSSGVTIPIVEVVATANGLTTAIITATGMDTRVKVTCDQEDKIIVLPAPVPGSIVWLLPSAVGYELRSSDPETVAINGGTGEAAEAAIPAANLIRCVCTSATTWVCNKYAANGTESKVDAAAAS